jgi:hypothetical protein
MDIAAGTVTVIGGVRCWRSPDGSRADDQAVSVTGGDSLRHGAVD